MRGNDGGRHVDSALGRREEALGQQEDEVDLGIREPDLLFTLAPQVAASGGEGRGAASFQSSHEALVSVKRLEANAELPSLHLVLASFEGESDEIHHSFD